MSRGTPRIMGILNITPDSFSDGGLYYSGGAAEHALRMVEEGAGISLLDSVTIAMSSISIGGFLNTNDSLLGYDIFVKIAVMIFMVISASNFYLHYRALFKGDIRGYGRSEEFKTMVLWFFIISVLIVVQCILSGTWSEMPGGDGDKFVDIMFSIVSVGTTSGFSTVDNYTTHWPFVDLSL